MGCQMLFCNSEQCFDTHKLINSVFAPQMVGVKMR